MKWLKILWGYIWKKNIVKQNKVNQQVINTFGKRLDDAIDFNKAFKGKLALFEKYDDWAFIQAINTFIFVSGNKFSDEFWKKFETCLALFNAGNHAQASIILSKDLNKVINTGLRQSVEEFILQRQVLFLLELASKFISGDFEE